ncbi:glycosyltransferase [Pedobacter metabolipauper]|uniref:Glycosyltransferase involved in cell wall biosynthesis n=1 Tax=Pedobacter metabolipauper TaxID=425513 RepID=A0A4R6SZV5_9SPHI|nr:glycosyltransferase [Pedobacter metabolipauper]TDQ12006.1 glycosyltransferase involved in cell wall biosynthesis [Pedobacter metabolipauper]
MKILHITAYITGGAGIAVKRLHEALLAQNIDSKILCMYAIDENISREVYVLNKSMSLADKLLGRFHMDKKSKLMANLEGKYEAFTFPFSTYKLHEHPLVLEADIIHLHWISDFVDLDSFLSAVKKPIVWTAHDLNPILGGFHYEQDVTRNPSFFKLEEKLKQEKHQYILKSNIQFIGSSTLTVNKIREYLPSVKCIKIPCILDTVNFKPVDKKIARKALNLDDTSILLGTGADSLENYRKGYWLLMQAILDLTDTEKQQIKVISFGDVKKKQHHDPEIPEVIQFEPLYNKRLHSLVYSSMDFFIVPSLEETFGLTGTEALLCNTPLIAADTGGMSDYTTEGVNGTLFKPGSAAELTIKIKEVIHRQKDEVSARDCRTAILKWYTEQDPVNRHIELYKELIQQA